MAGNSALNKANKAKKDEFYTQLTDIEAELKHYKKHFLGKTVLCNCDDPYESNFFKYFAMNFNHLGLKKLIATCYTGSSIMGEQLSFFTEAHEVRQPYKIEITVVRDANKDGAVDLCDVEELILNNENALTLLKEADIVVTNPPFSLFREYVAQLMEYGKQFLIIGNQNAVTYKEIFPLLKEDKMWLGYHCGDMAFTVPDHYEERETRFWIDDNGKKWRSFGNICWFTNLDIPKRHEELELYKHFSFEEFPVFDNYNAINVDKVSDIPEMYFDPMGVPITFLDKHNPEQFEILNANDYRKNEFVPIKKHGLIKDKDGSVNGKAKYVRILIRRRQNGN